MMSEARTLTKPQRARLDDGRPLTPRNAQSRNTVTVACKHPSGIELRAYEMVTKKVAVQGGMVEETIAQHVERLGVFVCKGNATAVGMPTYHLVGGYALTDGCPEELWDLWFEANKDSALVKNGLIFAHRDHDYVVDQAKEQRAIRSGLERIDPNKPQNLVPQIRKGTTDNEAEEE